MRTYDDEPRHPLHGVPTEVRRVASEALGAWEFTDDWRDIDVQRVADAVVANMRSRGYVTWPGRVPDRESLVLALQQVDYEYQRSHDESRSYHEWLVDDLVLPLLHQVSNVTDAGTSPER